MNALTYGAMEEMKFEAMARQTGYKRISTFYSDLSIAEYFEARGVEKGAIEDTYNRVCNEWLSDYKMFTEFVLCLNWKVRELYETNDKIARLYNDLWSKAATLFCEKHEGNDEAMSYYFKTTD